MLKSPVTGVFIAFVEITEPQKFPALVCCVKIVDERVKTRTFIAVLKRRDELEAKRSKTQDRREKLIGKGRKQSWQWMLF